MLMLMFVYIFIIYYYLCFNEMWYTLQYILFLQKKIEQKYYFNIKLKFIITDKNLTIVNTYRVQAR